MNILVTGANGQLGNEMRIVARDSHDNYIFSDVVGDDIVKLDITDPDAVKDMVRKHDIDIIVNCAAYTNVDKAESDKEFAEKLNAKAAENLAEAMRERNGLLIHVSTDYVFGGSLGNTPRTEEEPANPTGVYGLTKLHGEEVIKNSGCKYVILRTAWLYSEFGKNFVKTMLNLTATKPQLKVVFDQVGTPTYGLDLARAIEAVIKDYESQEPKAINQIYHYSNEGVCSWYDFTKMIAEYAGNTECDIQPCHSDEFPSPVVRPSYSVLDKTKIKRDLGITIPYWTDSLRTCLANLK
ncbi:MAG: dTDP-4-dehydrorhamnose reductase [Bacteroidales bacterium]|nr:dTDP-4-dehydrorhamnose reductase [Bacteroidales bacterium]